MYKNQTKYKKNFITKSNIRGKYYNRFKFKKKKWIFLVKNFDFRKKIYKFKKSNKKPKFLKKFYKQKLLNKQKFQNFYGNINYSKLKIEYKKLKKKKIRNPINNLKILLEKRLDILLYRLGFFSSIFESKQNIGHKKVWVNGNLVFNSNYKLNPGDFIQLKKKRKKKIRILPYIYYKKKFSTIIFLRNPKIKEIIYPFFLDSDFLLNFLNNK